MHPFLRVTITFFLLWIFCFACASNKPSGKVDNAFTYFSKSIEQYQLGDFSKALELINQAIDSNDRIARYYEIRGDIKIAIYKPLDAIDDYKFALSLRSYYPQVLLKLAKTQYSLKHFDEAIPSYRKALTQQPQAIDLKVNIADCYLQKNEKMGAENQLIDYFNLTQHDSLPVARKYYIIQGKLDFENGKFKECAGDFKMARLMEELNRNEAIIYVRSLFYSDSDDRAYQLISNELKNVLDEADVHFFRGLYYYKKNKLNDAQTQFSLAVEKRCIIYEVYEIFSGILEKSGETELSKQVLKKGQTFKNLRFINLAMDTE